MLRYQTQPIMRGENGKDAYGGSMLSSVNIYPPGLHSMLEMGFTRKV